MSDTVNTPPSQPGGRIAVIGMSCRVPGAENYEAFWDNLQNERCSVSEIPPERWSTEKYFSPQSEEPNKANTKRGGFIADADSFDAMYFGISPREAQYMDPQQRIVLELASSCFEDAGYSESKISGSRTAVFIGTGHLDHGLRLRESQQPVSPYWATGVHLSVIPNRISYAFNLCGPSVSVDTACSGSLLALHHGIQSLRSGDATMALIGGCAMYSDPTHFVSFSKMGMLSPDGLCRTFDESANGYVRGEGAAFVLIKSEEQALADGDRILGIISGTAVNHGGRARTLTSPNAFAQARVIFDAHMHANVPPDSISYIEAHGTGTPKGDPIEIVGLKRAFAKLAEQSGISLKGKSCAIGSAKTNIGHLEPAAGMAGLVKILLSMQHNVLPKLLNFNKLNPRIDLAGSPFYILDKTEAWIPPKNSDGAAYPRRAGISSFGFGGANAHAVIEQAAPAAPRQADKLPRHLICLSAKTAEALSQQQIQLARWLAKKGSAVEMRDLSLTLLVGRDHREFRLAFPARDITEVIEKLGRTPQSSVEQARADVFFGAVAPGQSAARAELPDSAANLLASLRRNEMPEEAAHSAGLSALAELFSQGAEVDWSALFATADARRIALPTYPFAKKKYPFLLVPSEENPSMPENIPMPSSPVVLSAITPDRAVASVSVSAASAPIKRPRIALQTLSNPSTFVATAAPAAVEHPVAATASVEVPAPSAQPSPLVEAVSAPQQAVALVSGIELEEEMRASLAAALYLEVEEVDTTRSFVEQGLDSVVGVEWMRTLNRRYAMDVTVTKLYDYPTVESLAVFIAAQINKKNAAAVQQTQPAASKAEQPAPQQAAQQASPTAAPVTPAPVKAQQAPDAASLSTLRAELAESLASVLYMERDMIQADRPFVDLGLDSVVGVEWIRILNKRYGMSMPATKLYDYATINVLASYLLGEQSKNQSPALIDAPKVRDVDASPPSAGGTPVAQSATPAPAVAPSRPSKPLPVTNYGLTLTTVHTLDEVSISDWVLPMPAQDEVTIRVLASAINFPDVMCVQGLYPTMPAYPFVPGFEVAGVVSRVGAGVTTFKVGDEVIGLTGRDLGGHASHVNVQMRQLIHKPKNMTFEDACSIPVIFLTVQHAFNAAKLAPHEHVLIQTATGGCGLAAIQMARLLDCVCYGTSSKDTKLAILKRIGVDHVINYKTAEFDKEVLSLSQGRGVDAVLNMLAGDAIQRGLNCLAPLGRYLEIAVHALRTSQKLDLSRLVQNQSLHSIDMRRLMLDEGNSDSELFTSLLPLFESGQLVPVVSRIYPVGQIVDALRYVTQGEHIGKVVISHTATQMVDSTEQCIEAMIAQARNAKKLTQAPALAPVQLAPRSVPAAVTSASRQSAQEGIAVIGMSGQFPQAKNLQQFWQNLSQGKDCIDEIPANRWAVSDYFDASGKAPNKTVCKWMGALEDVDHFDPLFFNIAPAEARLMDPEQRLFLQNVWHCLEDAGIPASALSGSKCGVFVGCAPGDYGQRLGAERLTAQGLMGGSASILAGRVAYYLNLQGPCLSIDTACSSSLAAVAQACDSLAAGSSHVALAGGAYVMAGPSMHIMTSQAGMLSKTGRCHTFDQSADGFVPGEGIGVVLLKRLSDAERDGDKIYGVIKGWGIKQDGKTNGITAPSVNSQIALEKEIYERFAINPENISLVEAHGTGTKLGDPIEVEALSQSFGAYTDKKQYCALGSVKANIGHGLTSAGIGGLIKVMLCMEHKKLVPTANYSVANEHINLADSPFFVNTAYRDWLPSGPTRMAAMSSFGFSGTNVHLVMEEHAAAALPKAGKQTPATQLNNEVIIVLSAKSEAQLKTSARNLAAHLKSHGAWALEDVAYTLQVGREPMDVRLAFGAASHDELLTRLADYAAGTSVAGSYAGTAAAGNNKVVSYFKNDADAQELVRTWMRKKNVAKLTELWSQGLDLNWHQLYDAAGATLPQRISLPGYPFAQESYWVTPPVVAQLDSLDGRHSQLTHSAIPHAGSADVLHPLLHRNVSTFSQQRFVSHFSGEEFFLADHQVRERKVLPATAHLEMARAALTQSLIGSPSGAGTAAPTMLLQDMTWIRPIVVEREVEQNRGATADVMIVLESKHSGQFDYQIVSHAPATAAATATGSEVRHIYSTGSALFSAAPAPQYLNISQLRADCNVSRLGGDDCYAAFAKVGLQYGVAHRGVVQVYRGVNQALAQLRLADSLLATQADYGLHPALLDSALQACIALLADANGALDKLALPYKMRALHMLSPCTANMWAYVRRTDGGTPQDGAEMSVDIDLCDDTGLVCVRILGFSLQELAGQGPAATRASSGTFELGLAQCDWQESHLVGDGATAQLEPVERTVIFCEIDGIDKTRARTRLIDAQCLFFDERTSGNSGAGLGVGDRFQQYAEHVLAEIKRLFRQTSGQPMLLQVVYSTHQEQQLVTGLSGMLRAAQLENAHFFGQLIGFDAISSTDMLIDRLQDERLTDEQRIRYQYGHQQQRRMVARWNAVPSNGTTQAWVPMPWKADGVYLITGGAGGLGFIFAEEIIRQHPTARLILTGRSVLTAAQQSRLQGLRQSAASGGGNCAINTAANIQYCQVDVADKQAVAALMASIKADFGRLNGVIHSAGVVRDSFILQKELHDVAAVMAPKVVGVLNLDLATHAMELDFFVVFSSLAGVMGNIGQADYAAANAFADAYVGYRDQLVQQGQRKGKSLSINWPLWADGGMQVDQASQERIRKTIGIIGAEEGTQAFYRALAQTASQIAVTAATPDQLTSTPKRRKSRPPQIAPEVNRAAESGSSVVAGVASTDRVTSFVLEVMSKMLKIPADRLDLATPFEKYGVDSIVQASLIQEMGKTLGELPVTLLFENTTMQELIAYLTEHHSGQFIDVAPAPAAVQTNDRKHIDAMAAAAQILSSMDKNAVASAPPKQETFLAPDTSANVSHNCDIAIIGISGRYPQSETMEQLWKNLRDGRNCVSAAPAGRWEHAVHGGIAPGTGDVFGGFLDAVDRFDGKLFEIDSAEATRMTPELRLFLETVWETLEDAGYSKSRLQAFQDNSDSGIGVFVGSMYSQYGWSMPSLSDALMQSNETEWQLANRVSHFFDLRGPSLAVNTACSSSMTAIHLACESLRQSGCSMAIAGGVNLTLDRSKYDRLRDANILDEGGQSKSFGLGEGYVPGEGVGAVLLKPLALAIRDNDRIEAVIKSSAINHSGGRQKYTVPDPKGQADLIRHSLKQARIDPETISYVESAATGSPLGDPIEVLALKNAFAKSTKRTQFCALGSVKSNLGHLEAASGISQLSKVLLQLKHKTLVPSIHAEPMNPGIKLDNSPFYLQKEPAPWHASVDPMTGLTLPRRSMINSFGAGGTYSNLIVEEYLPQAHAEAKASHAGGEACVFSAMSDASLQRYLGAFAQHLHANPHLSIVDVASSLRKINHDLPVRVAVVATSSAELLTKLTALLDGRQTDEAVFLSTSGERARPSTEGEGMQQALTRWVMGDSAALQGLDYATARPCLSLPKYAFDHDGASDLSYRNAAPQDGRAQGSEDIYRSIFEKIAQGSLSEKSAWELVQIAEA